MNHRLDSSNFDSSEHKSTHCMNFCTSMSAKFREMLLEGGTVDAGTSHMVKAGIDPHLAVSRVIELSKSMTIEAALREVGITRDQYYKTKRGITNKRKK